MTVRRFQEILQRLSDGRSLREIARALGCSRDTVREVRDGLRVSPDAPKALPDPLWMLQLDWPAIIHDLGLGHPLKFLWEEKAQHLTSYPNFWKQFYRKFPHYRLATVTAREFAPAERVEVDYAGDPIEWVEVSTGVIHKTWVFVSALGFSQLLFARAAEDMKNRNWLGCHRRMFAFYGGVSHVTVPDCLKQGVLKCHRYDPDLNPGYAALGAHFATAIVPARPGHPKDKAIVEGAVKILMHYLRFRYRRTTFTSLTQINQALAECVQRINDRRHSRFGVSPSTRAAVIGMAGASKSMRTSRRTLWPITNRPRRACCRSHALSTQTSMDCWWSYLMWTSSVICAGPRALCVTASKKSIRPVTKSLASALPPRSPPCAAITATASPTSRHCWPKHANKIYRPRRTEKSYAAPATPCCVTPLALTRLFPPRLSRRV